MARFFANIDHADDHRREYAAGFERLHDRLALLHRVVNFRDGVSNDDVARGIAGDIQRLQNRYTGSHERSQGAAKS